MNLLETIITIISFIRQKEKRPLIQIAKEFKKLNGIEIGGPSSIFKLKGAIPIYLFASKVDGVNFANNTLWEGKINEGDNYNYYNNLVGHQFIAEGTNLSEVKTGAYDFVLSCHSLEHIANPIKALKEWNRVLVNGGKIVLVLPNKDFTFDVKRPISSIEHLISDYLNDIQEDDNTHYNEVISMHDLTRDEFMKSRDQLESRTLMNLNNRALHHHVFDFALIQEMLNYAGFDTVSQYKAAPFHLISVAEKVR